MDKHHCYCIFSFFFFLDIPRLPSYFVRLHLNIQLISLRAANLVAITPIGISALCSQLHDGSKLQYWALHDLHLFHCSFFYTIFYSPMLWSCNKTHSFKPGNNHVAINREQMKTPTHMISGEVERKTRPMTPTHDTSQEEQSPRSITKSVQGHPNGKQIP